MEPSEKIQMALDVLEKKLSRQAVTSLAVCVHCGMCTDACHYYVATQDPKMAPAYKADHVRKLFKRHFDWMARIAPGWVGGRSLKSQEDLDTLKDVLFGSCTMCRRCTLNCPMGVDKALLIRIGRAMLMTIGEMPQGVIDVNEAQWTTGNQMSVTDEDYLETIEWLSEEHQMDVGDSRVALPLDQQGASVVYVVNPREVKYAPLTLLSAAKIFHVAREDWTMPTKGWDGTNFGLFSGDDALGAEMGKRMFNQVRELGGKRLVVSECGHGFRATRWEAPNWAKEDLEFPIESMLETMCRYLDEGRIKLDKSVNTDLVTYHDPCNLGRSSGITEEPRRLIRESCAHFIEMQPNRADNWCCSGGGGAMSMAEYTGRRLEVAKVKADQLRATGAKVVATACHNCVDALSDLIKHYGLNMRVTTVGELVADALVFERPPVVTEIEAPQGKGERVLVVDDEPDFVLYLSTLLEDNGYVVDSATSVDAAMAKLRESKPDVITLDVIMPGQSGLQMYEELRSTEEFREIPIVVISGLNPQEAPDSDHRQFIYERRFAPPPDGFLDKPVDQKLLMSTLRKVMA